MGNISISYAEFAKALGVARQFVAIYVKRGNILANTKTKKIDYTLPQNKYWIDKQVSNGKTWDLNRINQPVNVEKTTKPGKKNSKPAKPYIDPYQTQMRDLEYRRKLEELKQKENANKLEEIKIKKLQGSLLPYDAVKSLFLFAVESYRTAFIQEINAIANIFVERLGANEDQFKDIQKLIADKINDGVLDFQEILYTGLDGIVEAYKEVRGRGEKK